jgi:hypothetical protein
MTMLVLLGLDVVLHLREHRALAARRPMLENVSR